MSKLLIVDDEPSNLHVMRSILSHEHDLMFAKSGDKAIELAETARPDLILMDVIMPEMNGFEVCEKLKASANTESIPVIFVSALDEIENEVEGIRVGACDFLTKPVAPEIVKKQVDKTLRENMQQQFKMSVDHVFSRLFAYSYRDDPLKFASEKSLLASTLWLAEKWGVCAMEMDFFQWAFPIFRCCESSVQTADFSFNEIFDPKFFEQAPTGFLTFAATFLSQETTRETDPTEASSFDPNWQQIWKIAQKMNTQMWSADGDIQARFTTMQQAISREFGAGVDSKFALILSEHQQALMDAYQVWILDAPAMSAVMPLKT